MVHIHIHCMENISLDIQLISICVIQKKESHTGLWVNDHRNVTFYWTDLLKQSFALMEICILEAVVCKFWFYFEFILKYIDFFSFIYSFGWSKLKGPIRIIPCEFKGGQSTIKLNLRSSLPAVYHDGWIYETSAVHKHILTSARFFFPKDVLAYSGENNGNSKQYIRIK